jgi:hypothetical protein
MTRLLTPGGARSTRNLRARVGLFLVLTAAVALGSTLTVAQTHPSPRPAAHPAARRPKADAGPPAATDVDAATEPMTGRPENLPSGRGAPSGGSSHEKNDVLEAKTLDGGGKVFRFGEVEIEGRLRSPQLVYFLRRVRAEFAAGDLGHRSFIREMSDTRREPSF